MQINDRGHDIKPNNVNNNIKGDGNQSSNTNAGWTCSRYVRI